LRAVIRVGTAGWSVPKAVRAEFPAGGSILECYAQVFNAVEINSSFYRPHKPQTYARWAASTPEGFRFAVKLPKAITHERRLVDGIEPLDRFLTETAALGVKRGPILIQLPPSLPFDAAAAARFLNDLRDRYDGEAACEPRHASWFTAEADALLVQHRIARVAADPALPDTAAAPCGWTGFTYWRWHGSPQRFVSAYGADRLTALAPRLGANSWVIFDNTMSGAAAQDALRLKAILRERTPDAKLAP
jgi:uncharacterized protein YecE (DUF72 family)